MPFHGRVREGKRLLARTDVRWRGVVTSDAWQNAVYTTLRIFMSVELSGLTKVLACLGFVHACCTLNIISNQDTRFRPAADLHTLLFHSAHKRATELPQLPTTVGTHHP
jgi:hypothetical protein